MAGSTSRLADALDAALPQTQCRRCGYPDCHGYAEAMASGQSSIDRCPPGGAEGIRRLAAITGRPQVALDPGCGVEAPRTRAVIDEAWCIGCTLCIQACPVDCIVGAPKRMHTVIADQCTGCELCLPACPVDCIALVNVTGTRSGWAAWSATDADAARARYQARAARLAHASAERDAQLAGASTERMAPLAAVQLAEAPASPPLDGAPPDGARARIEAALARARARRQDEPR